MINIALTGSSGCAANVKGGSFPDNAHDGKAGAKVHECPPGLPFRDSLR